mmetsp:Transcript_89138/g.148037  ORF Transcript_89138/g.148037 Transcript_89138/m.148037 type:complete len:218 (-) Transcript_89138:360-1013(-)
MFNLRCSRVLRNDVLRRFALFGALPNVLLLSVWKPLLLMHSTSQQSLVSLPTRLRGRTLALVRSAHALRNSGITWVVTHCDGLRVARALCVPRCLGERLLPRYVFPSAWCMPDGNQRIVGWKQSKHVSEAYVSRKQHALLPGKRFSNEVETCMIFSGNGRSMISFAFPVYPAGQPWLQNARLDICFGWMKAFLFRRWKECGAKAFGIHLQTTDCCCT